MESSGEVTRLLDRLSRGEQGAADQLLPLIYAQLHDLASTFMAGGRPGDTLQPTALVHEAYLKLLPGQGAHCRDHEHFLALAAKAMRSVLVDHARRRRAQKRSDGGKPLPLDEGLLLAFE